MVNRSGRRTSIRPNILALAVMSCFTASGAWANPTGPTPVTPGVSFSGLNTSSLQVTTTSPKSVINWQGFSIGSGEITSFQQMAGPSSAVLNRVTTLNNPSLINGSLYSNGQVFLINPSGIAIGPSGSINVAAFVASSLNLSDPDFLSGHLHFGSTPGAGTVENWGNISTPTGGHVYLVGAAVTNGGFISTPQGEAILAAGNSVELVDPGTPNVAVEIVAPDNQARNLGTIMADAGRVGIYAGLIDQRGTVSADTAMVTDDGKIVFRATQGVNFAASGATHASGPGGGSIDVDAAKVTVSGAVYSNTQTIHTSGDVTVAAAPGSIADLEAHSVQSIRAGGAVEVKDAGPGSQASILGSAQTIEARNIEVSSTGGDALIINSLGGDQAIRTDGMNAAGEGLEVRSSGGGFATIQQIAPGAQQMIDVKDADRVVIDAAGGFATINSVGGQDISITGATSGNALLLGSPTSAFASQISAATTQSVTAGLPGQSGSITLYGDTTGGPANTFIVSGQTPGGAQDVSTSGTLSILGGSAPGGSTAGIFANGAGGQQTVKAEAIALHGGDTGFGNSATIGANQGAQLVVAGAGGITLTGGDGANALATLVQRDPSLNQRIEVHEGGSVVVQGGSAGSTNAAFVAPVQIVNVDGDVTLQGGSGPNSGVRIGGLPNGSTLTTDLTLNAGGDVALRGGSGASAGAALGALPAGGVPAKVTVRAGGDITLDPNASGAVARIGSPTTNVAGGDIVLDAGGTIALNSVAGIGSSINTLDNVTLSAGSISEGVGSSILAGALSALSLGDVDIAGTITSGPQSILAGGDLTVHDSGPGTTATIQGSGQTIEARSVEVASNGGTAQILNVGSGDQTIRTSGMNAAGEGLAVRTLGVGGIANIEQMAPGGTQDIEVSDADRVVVDAGYGFAGMGASDGSQNVSITGTASDNRFVLGSPSSFGGSRIYDYGGAQSIVAGLPGQNGAIDIYGNTSGGFNRTYISYRSDVPDSANVQSVSTSGALSVYGGSGSDGNNNSGIFATAPGGKQTVEARAILLQGGGDGSPGGGNGAMIGANSGAQTIVAGSGGITLHGGGAYAQALFYDFDTLVTQSVDVRHGGSLLIQGGGGSGAYGAIIGATQDVNVDGDVTLQGGTVPNSGVRIGGLSSGPLLTTNLALNAGGDVTLRGGNGTVAGAALGSTVFGGQAADVIVHAGGDIALVPGTSGAGAYIGTSPTNVAGGDVLLDARGNITLDSAGPGAGTFIATLDDVTLHARSITEGADSSIIAHTLSASARHGIDLPGANKVAQFDADTLLSGGVTFNNASSVLNVTGIDAFPFGAVNLTQTGDLLVTGNMLAGRQNIAATGDITVGPAPGAPGVSVFALGPQSISAGGALRLQGGDADNGYVEVGSLGRLSVSTGGDLSLTGGSGQYAHALLWSLGRMDLSVGGTQTLTDGSGQYAWARILRARP